MNSAPRIFVLIPKVPLVWGGTEKLAENLVSRLIAAGYQSDLITIPYKWEPREELLREAMTWRMFNLDCDMVIPMKFPAYYVNHKVKVPWLTHQFRQVYDLFDTPFSGFSNNLSDAQLRQQIYEFDQFCLSESKQIYTIAANTQRRLQRYNGITAEVLYPPTGLEERLQPQAYEPYLLAVGRLEEVKRFDLLIRAIAATSSKPLLKIVGTGSQLESLQNLAQELGVQQHVSFLGAVDDDELIHLYNHCLAVHFAPLDEDFGLVTLEAMHAGKPVITANDSGGPCELIENQTNGLVAPATPHDQAEAIDALFSSAARAENLGRKGKKRASEIRWSAVIETLCQWVPQ